MIYYNQTGLRYALRGEFRRQVNAINPALEPKTVRIVGGAEVKDVWPKGPSVHIIDRFALIDPFLSRIPVHPANVVRGWRIGHIEREIPAGYLKSLQSGQNLLQETTSLAALFDIVEKARRAPLLSAGRLRAIWFLNTGEADRLANAYRAGVRVADSVPGSAQNAGQVIRHGSLRDDFASGYFVEAQQTWISPDFRMTLTRPRHGEVLVVGWLPDVLAYPGGRLPIRLYADELLIREQTVMTPGKFTLSGFVPDGARQLRIVSAQRATGGGDDVHCPGCSSPYSFSACEPLSRSRRARTPRTTASITVARSSNQFLRPDHVALFGLSHSGTPRLTRWLRR